MDITVTGRKVSISERFREHLEEKLQRIAQIAPRVTRVDVVVTHETNPRQTASEVVEITCYEKRHIVRAEAAADDKMTALDLVLDKLVQRLRRLGERRSDARQGGRAQESLADLPTLPAEELPAALADTPPRGDAEVDEEERVAAMLGTSGNSPIQVRSKTHQSRPMGLSDALDHMEMLGHDFFLFVDEDTRRPSVVYRRRGWSYGVIALDVTDAPAEEPVEQTA